MKTSRAALNALIIVANPAESYRGVGAAGAGGISVAQTRPVDLSRDFPLGDLDVLVVDGGVAGHGDLIVQIRSSNATLPILFLAERLSDVAAAIAAGATDFATTEASPAELEIRMQVLASGVGRSPHRVRMIGVLRLDRDDRTLSHGSKSVTLSPIELKIFERLLLEPGRPIPRFELERSVWGADVSATNAAVVYVSYLRKKLARFGDLCAIRTITGVGYVLEIKGLSAKAPRQRART